MLLVDVSIGVANDLAHYSVVLAVAVRPAAESTTRTPHRVIKRAVARSRSVSVSVVLCKTVVIFVSRIKLSQLCDHMLVCALLAVLAETSVGCLIQHKVLSLYVDQESEEGEEEAREDRRDD